MKHEIGAFRQDLATIAPGSGDGDLGGFLADFFGDMVRALSEFFRRVGLLGIATLAALGYKVSDAEKAVRKAVDILGEDVSTEELVRTALSNKK